jgi:two-component system LytT family sensor kinase
MTSYQMSNSKFKTRPILLHLLFWACLLALPVLLGPSSQSTDPAEVQRHFQWNLFFFVFGLANIPLFYINTEILIPKVLKKYNILMYLGFLVLGYFVMVWLNDVIFDLLFPDRPVAPRRGGGGMKRFTYLRIIFQYLFIIAIGISYRFLADNLYEQEAKKEEENERLKSELSFLRSQISPHFMFNVLNSIVSLSRRKPASVEPVVIKLSELMRYMIYETSDSKVAISKEDNYLESYIELQKLRFGTDIEINYTSSSTNSAGTIEPMLLIPFVENAFKHGVGMISHPSISISLSDTPEALTFEVTNQVSKQKVEQKDDSSGIGLTNVRRRLELLYPETHTLAIVEENGEYRVKLTIKHV